MSGHRCPWRVAVGTVVLAAIAPAWAGPASDDETAHEATTDRPVIALVVLGGPDEVTALQRALGVVATTRYDLRWTRADRFEPREVLDSPDDGRKPGSAARVTIRCWVDLRDTEQARLYFRAAASDRFLVRAVSLAGASNEMNREMLAQIIETSLKALLSDTQAGMARTEAIAVLTTAPSASTTPVAPPPAPAPPAPPVDRRPTPGRTRGRAGVDYAITGYSNLIAVVHGPGLTGSLEHEDLKRSASLRLRVGYAVPQGHDTGPVNLQVEMLTFRADADFLFQAFANRVEVGPSLGVGLDLTWISSQTLPPLESVPVTASPTWVFRSGLLARFPMGPHLRPWIELDLEVDPAAVHYDVEGEATRSAVLERERVRPGLVIGTTVW